MINISSSSESGGSSSYVYVRYASDDIGTGISINPGTGLNYIAVLNSPVDIPSPVASDFSGLWRKYIGSDGITYVPWIAFAEDNMGTNWSLYPNTSLKYMAWKAMPYGVMPTLLDFVGLWGPFLP